MAVKPETKKTLLGAISLNARAVRDSQLTLSNLIARAVERGIAQTEVAAAAGVSQAHVSRTLAAYRAENEKRQAARRSRRKSEGGTV
jgi:predicted transcriptional regulator